MTTAELIEKLERAEGPSRELDAEIAALVHVDADGLDFEAFPEPSGRVTIYFPSKVKQAYPAPRYTASIDAAMGLVPEGCDRADHVWPDTGGGYCTYLWGKVSDVHSIVGKSRAATPTLALAAAALKAKEADNG